MHRLPGTGSATVRIRALAYTLIPPLLVLLGVALAKALYDVPVETLTRETTTVAGLPAYYGMVSTIGYFGWAAATGIFLLGAGLAKEWGDRRQAAFLGYIAALSFYLCIDDAFTLHEEAFPALGIPEEVVYGAIGLATLGLIVLFRREIRSSAWIYLLLAVGMLGFSVVIDEITQIFTIERAAGLFVLAEDGSKLIGIFLWATYSAATVRGLVSRRLSPAAAGAQLGRTH